MVFITIQICVETSDFSVCLRLSVELLCSLLVNAQVGFAIDKIYFLLEAYMPLPLKTKKNLVNLSRNLCINETYLSGKYETFMLVTEF